MLIDHTCDTATFVINSFVIQRVMQIGENHKQSMIGMLVSTMPFYYAILE